MLAHVLRIVTSDALEASGLAASSAMQLPTAVNLELLQLGLNFLQVLTTGIPPPTLSLTPHTHARLPPLPTPPRPHSTPHSTPEQPLLRHLPSRHCPPPPPPPPPTTTTTTATTTTTTTTTPHSRHAPPPPRPHAPRPPCADEVPPRLVATLTEARLPLALCNMLLLEPPHPSMSRWGGAQRAELQQAAMSLALALATATAPALALALALFLALTRPP
jgi:hypothetical protein